MVGHGKSRDFTDGKSSVAGQPTVLGGNFARPIDEAPRWIGEDSPEFPRDEKVGQVSSW